MHAAGAVHDPARRDPGARRWLREHGLTLALSVALHLFVFVALPLVWPNDARPAAVPPAAIMAALITLPSAPAADAPAPEAAPVAKAVARPKPTPVPNARLAQAPTPPLPAAPAASPPPTTGQAAPSTTTTSVAGAIGAAPSGPVMVQFPHAYLARMSRTIALQLIYPAYSRQFGQEGRAIVRVTLRRDGTILDAEVVRRTGHPYLDAEARNVILRIARFPPVPEHVLPTQAEFVIDQPISFRRS